MKKKKSRFDKEAASWDQEPGRIRLANDIAGAITEEIGLTSAMDVLDFGCGTGLLTVRLQPLVNSITGADSSQGMLDVLKSKIEDLNISNVSTRLLDLDKGDVLEGSYNLIISCMTFHHIKETGALLHQFHKVSAPGGYICIADLDLDDGRFHENNEGVFHFGFDRAGLRSDLIKAGYEDVRDRTAAKIIKPTPDGVNREFTIFLLTGRKRL
jgi:ubiquinone/menaquinone biosynthesis C-methylase UbiE